MFNQMSIHKIEIHKIETHKIEIHKIEIHKIEEHKIEIIVLKNFLNGSDSTDLRRHPQYKISLLMI